MDIILGFGFYRIIVCLAVSPLFLLGGLIIVAFLLTVLKGIRSRRWPVVMGRVITSGIATEEVEDELAKWALPDQAGVVYEYEADGKRYTADRLQVRGNMQTTQSVLRERELLGRYPPGKTVLVYYNPAKPQEAVLEPGVPKGLLPLTVWGAVFFLTGLGLGMFFIFPGTIPVPLATGVSFLAAGLGLILLGVWSMWTVVASRNWPATEAEVTHCEVEEKSDSSRFQASVAYQYEVEGVSYTSSAIDWGRFDMARGEAQRITDKYPVGMRVRIYYNPTAPYRAVIEPRGGWMYGAVLLMGVVFAVAGIIAILSWGNV